MARGFGFKHRPPGLGAGNGSGHFMLTSTNVYTSPLKLEQQ
jgi:hypothetical protein